MDSGLDKLPPRFIKDGFEGIATPLTHLLNLSLTTSRVLAEWKAARVTPIYKKGSKLEPGNYRPISILPCISKIIERIVNDQLSDHLLAHNLL